jgi:hypothetical protein
LTKHNGKQMNGAATAAPCAHKNHSFSNAVAQDAPLPEGVRGASSSAHGQGAANTVEFRRFWTRRTTMKGELPLERQAVQVQIDNGDWQAATYQDACGPGDFDSGCACARTMSPAKAQALSALDACAINCKFDATCIRSYCLRQAQACAAQ